MPTIYKNGIIYGGESLSAELIPAAAQDGTTSNIQAELDNLYTYVGLDSTNLAASHNGIYRGVLLVDTVDGNGKYTLAELYAAVTQGDFSDIYIGDIIKVNQAAVTYTPVGGSATTDAAQVVEWIVMGIDTYLGCGDTELTNHHLVLVPKNAFATAAHMNSTNTTADGYVASDMFTNILPAYETAVKNSLGSHVLTYRSVLSNNMNADAASNAYSAWKGCSSGWAWTDVTLNLLNEIEVFGTLVGGNLYDGGERNIQLPGFALNPRLKIKGRGTDGRGNWWLSAVYSAAYFAAVATNGFAGYASASNSYGVAPKILFG